MISKDENKVEIMHIIVLQSRQAHLLPGRLHVVGEL